MDDPHGDEHGDRATEQKLPDVRKSTPQQKEADRQSVTSDPRHNSTHDVNNTDLEHENHCRETGKSPCSDPFLTSNADNDKIPIASSEYSWLALDAQAPYFSNKRNGTPLTTDNRPIKRQQIQPSPVVMRPLTSLLSGIPLEDQSVPEEICNEQNHHAPTGLGTSYQPQVHSLGENRLDYHPGHPSLAHPPHSRGGGSHASNSYSANPKSSHQNTSPAIQTLDMRLVQRAQAAVPEAQSYQYEQANPPFRSPPRTDKSGPLRLGPPIWNEGQYRAERSHTPIQTPHRNNRRGLHWHETPFYDGGIPGEGGESSDEDIMLAPQVENRDVHMGGWRHHEASPMGPHAFGKPFQPLLKAVTLEDMWNGQNLINRRKRKLFSRSLASEWRQARDEDDLRNMIRLGREAKNAGIGPPRARTRGRMDQPPYGNSHPNTTRYGTASSHGRVSQTQPQGKSTSSRARIEDARHSPRGLIGYHKPGSQGRHQSRPIPAHAVENLRSQSQSGHALGPRPQDVRNRIRTSSAGKSLNETGTICHDHSDEEDVDDKDESSPMLGHIRNSRQNTEQMNIQATPYLAANILPKKSIAYNDRSKPTHTKNHCPQPHLLTRSRQTSVSDNDDFQTPQPKVRPRGPTPNRPGAGSSEVIILYSSAENTPASQPSVPMKDRVPPSQKKAISKSAKVRSEISQKPEMVKEERDPEVARQQMYADRIIAAEMNVTNEQLFGEVVSGTPEEKAHQETINQKEAQQKRNAIMKEKLAKEEASRLAEAQNQKKLEEARRTERLEKERERQSKKAKREAERKKQLALDAEIREEKRRKAEELINAKRAEEAAKAEARENDKKKQLTIEMDQLKIEVRKKDLELKKLQASTLRAAKDGTPNRSKSLGAKAMPNPPHPADDPDSVFIPDSQPNIGTSPSKHASVYDMDERARLRAKGPTNTTEVFANAKLNAPFREQIAEERVLREDRRQTEAIKRRLETRTSSAPLSSSPNAAEPVKEKQKKSRPARKNPYISDDPQSALYMSSQPLIIGNLIELEHVKPKLSKPASRSSTLAAIAQLPPPQLNGIFNSEVRYVEDVERERLENEQKARQEELKRLKNEQRRRNESGRFANRHRQKLLDEAIEGGYTIGEEELKVLVENYMKQRDVRYAKIQAKKAAKSAESSSFKSYLAPQPQAQSFNQNQPFTQPQSSSQSQIQHQSSSLLVSSETERDDNQPGTQLTQGRSTTQSKLSEQLTTVKRNSGGRFAKAAAKTCVNHFAADFDEPDSDESEEDSDETLEAMLAAKRNKKVVVNDDNGENQASELDSNDYGTQLEDGLNEAFDELSDRNQPQPSISYSTTNSSKSKFASGQSQNSSEMIRIYNVETTETKNGEEGEIEQVKMFTDRKQANNMGKDLFQEYRKNAPAKPHHITENYTEDELYTGTVVFDMYNSVTVCVTSKIDSSAKFAGLDVSNMKKLYGQNVWVIKRDLKKEFTDPDTNRTIITHIKEDANDKVYTDQEYANHQAAQDFIAYLKPKDYDIDEAVEWSNDWAPKIREALALKDKAGECFQVGLEREEGQLAWLEWDEVTYEVEVKETSGPRN